jgi:hypothetical protein
VQVGCIFAELLGMQYRVDSEGAGGGLSGSVWFRFRPVAHEWSIALAASAMQPAA